MDSLTAPYSATKRFATARKTESLSGKIILITWRKLTRNKTCRSCVTASEFIFGYNINCPSVFAMKIEKSLMNDKITVLCKTNIPPERTLQTTKQNFKKLLEIFKNHNCNPFQSSSRLSIVAFFCICGDTFWAVITKCHSIWWQYSLFEFLWIFMNFET